MLRHLLILTWKRKSRNLMLSLEILLAFAIVFGVAAFGLRYAQLYRMPLGFEGADVWSVSIESGHHLEGRIDPARYDGLRRGLSELPEVAGVAFASFEPYAMSTMASDLRRNGGSGKQVPTEMVEADDALAAVLGLNLVDGRWFSERDNGSAQRPVVINRRMAEAMFPGERALGQQFVDGEGAKIETTYRVVGVVDDYRAKGELAAPVNFVFMRFEADQPVGASHSEQADVRVVSATNRELAELVAAGEFREDLFYRLNLITIRLPPLRERRSDIPLLARHIVARVAASYGLGEVSLTGQAFEWLAAQPWPGNIRQLRQTLERTLLLVDKALLTQADFIAAGQLDEAGGGARLGVDGMTLEQVERHMIEQALAQHTGNISRVAKTLGLSRTALYRRLERHGLGESHADGEDGA